MYKIAIVEDEKEWQDELTEYIQRYGKEKGIQFSISKFNDGLDFMMGYRPIYDIIFLDIKMKYSNGMETAKKLRKLDNSVIIIFATNMAQYAVNGYEVDALSFIVKPILYTNFAMKLNKAIDRINSVQTSFINIKGKNTMKCIKTDDIHYVEVVNHSLLWHTVQGLEQSTGSLKNLKEELGPCFVLCNHCYLVNLRYCQEVNGYTLKIAGEELQISRSKRVEFVKSLNLYLNGCLPMQKK